jgi:hypothetical protein
VYSFGLRPLFIRVSNGHKTIASLNLNDLKNKIKVKLMKIISVKGHFFRGIEKNPYEIREDQQGKYVKMFTKNGSFLFDYDDLEKVKFRIVNNVKKNITWRMEKESRLKYRIGYYVRAHFGKNSRYLHQHIMDYYGKGCKGLTIDHIDRNPLNNRKYNLRLATKSQQNSNITKRSRGINGCPLPEEIKNLDLPKYISYTKFKKNTELGYRDGFIIQCHPSQEKKWLSTMSMKIPLKEKLKQSLKKLNEFNNQMI